MGGDPVFLSRHLLSFNGETCCRFVAEIFRTDLKGGRIMGERWRRVEDEAAF